MLGSEMVTQILAQAPKLSIGVIGDLFLDRYLQLDSNLTEESIETGMDAYQVTSIRSLPGAVGTVINNLAALGVGRIVPISIIGDDGEGYELVKALKKMSCVDTTYLIQDERRCTPTYTKPMLINPGQPAKELNRLDIKNRSMLPRDLEEQISRNLKSIFPQIDALIVLDQVSEANCGAITTTVRESIADLDESVPDKFILADSRERIHLFRSVCTKPNEQECLECLRKLAIPFDNIHHGVGRLADNIKRAVFCTRGESGMLVATPGMQPNDVISVPAYRVDTPIDIVGAGDSTSAAIASAVASGAGVAEAAAFGNLVASITIQQIGTTGTASPDQIRDAISFR